MKRYLYVICILFILFSFTSCIGDASFNGSRKGNASQLIMKYKIFNTVDEQFLKLEKGDIIDAEIVSDSGKVSVKVQKESETPVYDSENIPTSTFQIKIEESGTYKITVVGERAKGSVSFIKVKTDE